MCAAECSHTSVASICGNRHNAKLPVNCCLATGWLWCISRSPAYYKWSFPFAAMNQYLIIATSGCTLLNVHVILRVGTGAFCIIPNICLASMLYQQPLVPGTSFYLFLSGASLSLSLPVWLSLFLFQSLSPSVYPLTLTSPCPHLPLCVRVCHPPPLSPSYSCAFHRCEAE